MPALCRKGLNLAKQRVANFQGCLHFSRLPYLWAATTAAARLDEKVQRFPSYPGMRYWPAIRACRISPQSSSRCNLLLYGHPAVCPNILPLNYSLRRRRFVTTRNAIIVCVPNENDSATFCPIAREKISFAPPAGHGLIQRMDLAGNDCANAPGCIAMMAIASVEQTRPRIVILRLTCRPASRAACRL